jgi:quercetin dioxygenase-like cupin family protein
MSNEELDTALTPVLVPIIISPDEGTVLNAFGDTIQVKLTGEHTGGAFALGLSSTPPGGGPPPHRHLNEDELFMVLEGRISFLTNGEWTEIGPGGVAYVPRGSVHTFKNVGDTRSKQWVMATPSGFENFFGKCATVFAEAIAGPPDMGRILTICGEHGIEFVPPLGPPAPAPVE